jgi:hypothetical protein
MRKQCRPLARPGHSAREKQSRLSHRERRRRRLLPDKDSHPDDQRRIRARARRQVSAPAAVSDALIARGMARREVGPRVVSSDNVEDLQFVGAGRRQARIRLVARPPLRTDEGTQRRHQRAGARPRFRQSRNSRRRRPSTPAPASSRGPALHEQRGRVSLRLASLRALLRAELRSDGDQRASDRRITVATTPEPYVPNASRSPSRPRGTPCGCPSSFSDDAAKESNLPSRGLPGPASFEERPTLHRNCDLQQLSAVTLVSAGQNCRVRDTLRDKVPARAGVGQGARPHSARSRRRDRDAGRPGWSSVWFRSGSSG